MNEFKLNENDKRWLQAYNSIGLFWFFVDRYENHQTQIDSFDSEYNQFLDSQNFRRNGDLSIIDQCTLEALIFLTLSRIHEFIQTITENNSQTRNRFYDAVLSQFQEKAGIDGYVALTQKYNFEFGIDDYSNQEGGERLYQLVRAIRCKIVHFDNEFGRDWIKMKSKNKNKVLSFKISTAQLLNFCLHFSLCVNSVLHAN